MMVLTQDAINMLFRFLNLSLLLSIIGYIFIKKILPGLREQAMRYKAYFEQLWKSHRSLQKNTRLLKRDAAKDEEEQERLKQHVLQWQSVVRNNNDALLHERDARKKELASFFKAHQKQIALYRTYKRVVPEAIDHARKQLITWFAHDKEQQKFIKRAMDNLRK